MKIILKTSLILILLTSCATQNRKLTGKEKKVKLTTRDLDLVCHYVGNVDTYNTLKYSFTRAGDHFKQTDDLKKQSASLGANIVRITDKKKNPDYQNIDVYYGVAYKCPAKIYKSVKSLDLK